MAKFENFKCAICDEHAETFSSNGDYTHQDCPRCGKFKISGTLEASLHMRKQNAQKDHEVWVVIAKLSGWVRNMNMLGEVPIKVPMLSSQELDKILEMPIPGILERANRFLELASRSI